MNHIDISIVIPTYRRAKGLMRCLESVVAQDYPRERMEVIVIDDSPSGENKELLEGASQRYGYTFSYHAQDHKGPAAARNRGVRMSLGEVIGFVDDDCVMEQGWVRRMLEAHRKNPAVSAVGGWTVTPGRAIAPQVSQFLANGSIWVKIGGREQIIFFPTCNVSFKKEIFSSFCFDETFPYPGGEDLDFFWRLFKNGSGFYWEKGCRVIHYRRQGLAQFAKQAYVYGRGNLLVQHIHGDHPLLKELKTGPVSFWLATAMNILKIPRFSRSLGSRAIASFGLCGCSRKASVYAYFILHKIFYLAGNIAEFIRISRQGIQGIHSASARRIATKAPEFLILDLTHRCNLRCNMCDIRKDAYCDEFTTEEVKGLITQAQDWGVRDFVLSGGEPFVREDIFEILEHVRARGYRIGILTNGIVLTSEFITRLKPYLVEGVLSLSISLDALTPAIHDEIRGSPGAFARTSAGLQMLSELKKEFPLVNFNTISIVLNQNLEELLPLAESFKALGVNSIQFQPLLANNLVMKERSDTSAYWIPQDRLTVLDKVIEGLLEFKETNPHLVRNSAENLRLMKKYFRGTLTQQDARCFAVTRTMLIANTGDVTTCFDCYGNVRNASLTDIHASAAADKAARRVKGCLKPCLLPCFCDYQSLEHG